MKFPITKTRVRKPHLSTSTLLLYLLMMIIAGEAPFLPVHSNSITTAHNPTSIRPTQSTSRSSLHRSIRRVIAPESDVTTGRQSVWTREDTAIFKTPGIGPEIAHVGSHFRLTRLGCLHWILGTLWYPVQWSTPTTAINKGWIPVSAVTSTPPDNLAQQASLNVLTPSLMTYLAPFGLHVGVVVYDLTHRRTYTYQGNRQFLTASSMKVPIMLTFLDLIEHQRREPSDKEMALLTAMIEHSDNDAASVLYFYEIGGAAGVTNFLKHNRISGLTPSVGSWGYSLITPQAMVDLLTLLQQGKILTQRHRALALSLMEQVETNQRAGVGDTAPAGTIVAMKNGWVPAPDTLWAINTSGIVIGKKETYIIAVYTQEMPSFTDGQAITRQVCRAVASSLLSP